MKRAFAIFAAVTLVSPVFGASVIIDGTHEATIQVGTLDWNSVAFTYTLLSDSPTHFTLRVHGMVTADPRWCAGIPAELQPPDCTAPIDPFEWGDTFLASLPWPQDVAIILPLAYPAVDGYLYFGPTDGGRVQIDVEGKAVPEPASWAMMLGGFALVGGAMRGRKKASAVSFG